MKEGRTKTKVDGSPEKAVKLFSDFSMYVHRQSMILAFGLCGAVCHRYDEVEEGCVCVTGVGWGDSKEPCTDSEPDMK